MPPLVSDIVEIGGVGVCSILFPSNTKLTVKRVWERFGAGGNIMGEEDLMEISSISSGHPLVPMDKEDSKILVFFGARDCNDSRFFKALRYNFHGGEDNEGAWEETSVPTFAFWQECYRVMLNLCEVESSAA